MFLSGDSSREYPQNITYRDSVDFFRDSPARLWGVGAAIAFASRFGDRELAAKFIRALDRDYAPPGYKLRPDHDATFYPRHMVHALWGLAERDYPRREK